MIRLLVHPYRLGFRLPWASRATVLESRSGWILELRGSAAGYGECAPLPSAGTERPETADRLLADLPRAFHGVDELRGRLAGLGSAPALRCGLETALLDLEARDRHLPLRHLLAGNSADSFRVNAMAGPACRNHVEQACRQGYRTIKLKLGLRHWQEEAECLKALSRSLPEGVLLRLDANRAWSHATASRFLAEIEPLPVESLEEPLADATLDQLARLQGETSIPLAVDESLALLDTDELLSGAAVQRLMLKPTVLGGLEAALELARRANLAGMTPVVTSTLESAVGLHAACQLAAAVEALAPGSCHGLATSSWFESDLAPPPDIQAGMVRLDDNPGLGITP